MTRPAVTKQRLPQRAILVERPRRDRHRRQPAGDTRTARQQPRQSAAVGEAARVDARRIDAVAALDFVEDVAREVDIVDFAGVRGGGVAGPLRVEAGGVSDDGVGVG